MKSVAFWGRIFVIKLLLLSIFVCEIKEHVKHYVYTEKGKNKLCITLPT